MANDLRPDRIMNTGLGFLASKVLLSAVELNLFTELAGEPGDVAALSRRLGLHPRGARDFLDALVALGFLRREDRIYSNTPEADHYLDERKSSYVGGFLKMANNRLFPTWARLTDALRTGQPQKADSAGEGVDYFSAAYADPVERREFLEAMTSGTRSAGVKLARKFPWSECSTFVDVGAAQGDLAAQIARAHPRLRGTGFDLPAVEPLFAEYIEQNGLSDRVAFKAGDFFRDDLPGADVVIMGHVLHDWDLETKKMLVRKAHAALPDKGALIVFDAMIDEERSASSFGLLMSLNMLLVTEGGFDYTGADCIQWLEEAGFRDVRLEHLSGPDWMVIGRK